MVFLGHLSKQTMGKHHAYSPFNYTVAISQYKTMSRAADRTQLFGRFLKNILLAAKLLLARLITTSRWSAHLR